MDGAWAVLVLLCTLGMVAGRSAVADDGKYTVAAVQTELRFYATEQDFAAHMAERMAAAMQFKPDLIVFPEDVGMPLVALGDQDAIAGAKSAQDAIRLLTEKHAAEIDPLRAKYKVSPQRALFLLKAAAVRKMYEETFSKLARTNKANILAGTMPMVFAYAPSDVYNVACFFGPSGRMRVVARKVHPVDLEEPDGLDLSPASPTDSHPFNAGNLRVGCLICADAWDPAMAKRLVEGGAQLLVQVSANPKPWTADEAAEWRESLWARVQELNVYGVTCMGVGDLLGVPFQGASMILAPKAWTPDGSGVLAQAKTATGETVVVATLDLTRLAGRGARL